MCPQENPNPFNIGDNSLVPAYNMAKYSVTKLYRDGGIRSQKNFITGYQKCFVDLMTMINRINNFNQNYNLTTNQINVKDLLDHFFEPRGVSTEEILSLLQSNIINQQPPNSMLSRSRMLFKPIHLPIHLETLKKNATQKFQAQCSSESIKRKKAKQLNTGFNQCNFIQNFDNNADIHEDLDDDDDDDELHNSEETNNHPRRLAQPKKVRRRREP